MKWKKKNAPEKDLWHLTEMDEDHKFAGGQEKPQKNNQNVTNKLNF